VQDDDADALNLSHYELPAVSYTLHGRAAARDEGSSARDPAPEGDGRQTILTDPRCARYAERQREREEGRSLGSHPRDWGRSVGVHPRDWA
jgi:hypothetical protein